MKKAYFLVLVSSALLLMNSCRKIEQLPPEPTIEYKSFVIFDTTDILGNKQKAGKLNFYFKDGDGDIGMEAPATEQTDTNDLFIKLYRKKDGVMAPAPANDPLSPSTYRIPYIQKEGQNKILKGTISVTFLYLQYYPTDTIMYEFYIRDRALHESNVVETKEIIVAKSNTY